jgi:hypothetical protein
MLPLFLWKCDTEKIEPYPPYVFFTNDIDYYVMDMDNVPLVPYTIKGTVSAEQFIQQFKMGEIIVGMDSIGEQETRFQFEYPVTIKDRTNSFDVDFTCIDKTGSIDSKQFHFVKSEPIEIYSVTLGAQNNSNYGFYFSFKERKVYSIAEFEKMKDDEGLCFGYNSANGAATLLAPTELINRRILNFAGNKISSFCQVVSIDNNPFEKADFDAIQNDAIIRNLNGPDYGTYAFVEIGEKKSYLFKGEDISSNGLRGMVYVQKIEKGVAGYVELIIKVQK